MRTARKQIKENTMTDNAKIIIEFTVHPEVQEAIERTGETPSAYAHKVLVQTLMRDGFLKPPYPRPAVPASLIEEE